MLEGFFEWLTEKIAAAVTKGFERGMERLRQAQGLEDRREDERALPDESNGRRKRATT